MKSVVILFLKLTGNPVIVVTISSDIKEVTVRDVLSVKVGICGLMKVRVTGDCWCSEAEAALHVPVSPVSRLRAAVLQPVRPATQHQLPRRLAELDAKVRAAAVYGSVVPRLA